MCSALMSDMKMFGLAATTYESSKKNLKWQADVGGESTKCAMLKTQAMEAANLRVFVCIVKGGAELKFFQSTFKYDDFFFSQSLWHCY